MRPILADDHPDLRSFIKSVNGVMTDVVGAISFDSTISQSDLGLTKDAINFDGGFSADFTGRLLPDFDYTISFVCNLRTVSQSLSYVFAQGTNGETFGTNYNAIRFKTSGYLSVFTETNQGTNNTHDTIEVLFRAGQLDHIAITFTSSYFDVFRNGQFLYRENFTYANGTPESGSIGANGPAANSYIDGVLERIRVFNRVLTAAEIIDLSAEIEDKAVSGTAPNDSSVRVYNSESGELVSHVISNGSFSTTVAGVNDIDVVCKIGPESLFLAGIEAPVDNLSFASSEVDYHAWVRGNVTKAQMPFEASVAAFSLGQTPDLLGVATSSPETGDYEIDVAPYTGYVMVVDVMDYGAEFTSGSIVSAGEVIHPTTPNRRVYVAQNSGQLGVTEPEWIESGSVVSGEVVFLAKPLYQPQAGGYLKPLIEPK